MKIARKKHLAVAIAIILVLVSLYLSFNMVMDALVHSDKEVQVPDITGKNVVEAVNILSAGGLAMMKEADEFNEKAVPGTVIRQTPPANMIVREGKIIKVTLSNNVKEFVVPDITGRAAADSIAILERAGLRMEDEVVRRYSLFGDKGIVVAQYPLAGTEAKRGSLVKLIISEGPPPPSITLMPNWAGKNIDQVQTWAAKEHVNVKVIVENVTGVEGTVIKQSYEPDADITDAQEVLIYVVKK